MTMFGAAQQPDDPVYAPIASASLDINTFASDASYYLSEINSYQRQDAQQEFNYFSTADRLTYGFGHSNEGFKSTWDFLKGLAFGAKDTVVHMGKSFMYEHSGIKYDMYQKPNSHPYFRDIYNEDLRSHTTVTNLFTHPIKSVKEIANDTVTAIAKIPNLSAEELGYASSNFILFAGLSKFRGLSERMALRERVLANIADSKAARKQSNFKVHTHIEEALTLDVSTELDAATFWSGKGNRVLAENYALYYGKTTLEMTPGGNYLDSLDLFKSFPYEQAIRPWEVLSERFAKNASGQVVAFVKNASSRGIFNRIEYPALKTKPKVSKIILSPEVEFPNRFRR